MNDAHINISLHNHLSRHQIDRRRLRHLLSASMVMRSGYLSRFFVGDLLVFYILQP